jgi:hypothetical protein
MSALTGEDKNEWIKKIRQVSPSDWPASGFYLARLFNAFLLKLKQGLYQRKSDYKLVQFKTQILVL